MVLWRTLRRRGLQARRAERSTRINRRTSNRSWSSLYRRFGWFRRTTQAFPLIDEIASRSILATPLCLLRAPWDCHVDAVKRLCLRRVRPAWNVNLCKTHFFLPRIDDTRYRRPSEVRTSYFAHPFDFARRNNDFDRVLLEQRVIVAEMLPSDRLMDVRALYEERESVDKERI